MSSKSGILLSWVSLNVFPVVAVAADKTANGHYLAAGDSPVSFSYIMQILVSFAAVVLFILFLGWLMRKSGRFGVSGSKSLRIISSLSLGMREKIVVVNVEGVNIVVGMAPGQIRTLYVLGENTDKEHADPEKEAGGFGPILGKFLK